MATLEALKAQLGVKSLELSISTDKDNKPTDWLRHWDNDRRMAISIHKDTAKQLQADKLGNITSLALQFEQKEAKLGAYDAYRIVKYEAEPDMVL